MGRCYACGEKNMKESTRIAGLRLGYLGNKKSLNKYQRWGMTYQIRKQEKEEALKQSKQQKKNLILM